MTPAARVQAAIELLDQIIDAATTKGAPADRLIAAYFKTRRFAGSKDRRAVRELVYQTVRLCGPVPQTGRAAMLALTKRDEALKALFDGSPHGPAPIGDDEQPAATGIAPRWLTEKLAASGIAGKEAEALLERSSLDVRVNSLKAHRDTINLPETGERLSAPNALRFPIGTQIEQWPAFREGLIEVQDHGSQWACEAIGAQGGETIIDLCAGAGGKTLAIAASTGNAASIVACDTDKRRLGNLAPRALRARAQIDHTVLLDPGSELEALEPWLGKADRVLVDAPCSGSGTWRRNPESRWRLDKTELERLVKLQAHVLDIAAKLVKRGGSITYITCSLLDEEGTKQVEAFCARNGGFKPETPNLPIGRTHGMGRRLTPSHDGTDGFFVANLRSS